MPQTDRLCFLLIDDDEEDIELLSYGLRQRDPQMEIISFTDSKKALSQLSEMRGDELPSIILVDYQMPKLYGIDFIKQLRSYEHCEGVPAVLYSTTVKQVSETDKQSLNFYAISKGNDLEGLMKNVDDMIAIAKRSK